MHNHTHTHTAPRRAPGTMTSQAPLHSLFLRCCVALNNITALGRHVCVFVSEKKRRQQAALKGKLHPKTIVLSSFTNLCDFISSVKHKTHVKEWFRPCTKSQWDLNQHWTPLTFTVWTFFRRSYSAFNRSKLYRFGRTWNYPFALVQLKACHLLLQFTLNCMQTSKLCFIWFTIT